jgi:hypothetical protein
MFGRLGNQMFRYAAARNLQIKTGLPIKVSFHFVRLSADPKKTASYDKGWENSLQYFNVVPMEEYKEGKRLLLDSPDRFQKLVGVAFYGYRKYIILRHSNTLSKLWNMQKPWCKLLDKMGLWSISNGYYNFKNFSRKEYYIDGSLENSRYFDAIRDTLLKEFTPKYAPLHKNKSLYEELKTTNPVCVSIRTYREIAENERQSNLYSTHDKNYYIRAMEYMLEHVKNPLFFICSDDIEWVKENIDMSKYNVIYETGDDPVWEKMRLMYSCKHFIISNSSFSWWTQYLSRNSNKIVIAPEKWFNDPFQGYLQEEYMIKM